MLYRLDMASRYIASPWADAQSPDNEDIGKLAEVAYRSLPPEFRAMCGNLVLRVEELADPELISELGGSSQFDLLGLFQQGDEMAGLPVDDEDSANVVVLYRRAILDYWAETRETLGSIVTYVLVQEIGRQFGMSEDDLDLVTSQTEDEARREVGAFVQ